MNSPVSPGTKLGRYEIRSPLGAGGMGEVYLALDTELDRIVAIKILPQALASDEQRLRRFLQEAKAASALNHPHILTIHEIGTSDSIRFIATEFIDGDTLRQRINAGLKLTEILGIAGQVASALEAAHIAGIIHRDIKPENIMVRRDGYIKLLDFGLAKFTEPAESTIDSEAPTKAMMNTGVGAVMGTANYMSPEQAKGSNVDARTDLWSLGVVIYEMVTGLVPFSSETPAESVSLILQKEPPPLARYAHDVPAELERIVTKSLTKDREERYQSAKDLLIDLRNLKRKLEVDAEIDRTAATGLDSFVSTSGDQSVPATGSGLVTATLPANVPTTASSAEYIVSEFKHHKIAAVIGVILLVVCTVGLGFFFHWRNAGIAIESIAVLPFVNQDQDPDSEYLSDGMTESLIGSLSQLPKLKVKARSSVFRYKGKDLSPKTVGDELSVQAVLLGRVAQRGGQLTLSLELVDARTEDIIWSGRYSRSQTDLMSLQSEIARDVSDKLRMKLSGADEQRVAKNYTANAEAYKLYLQGRFHWNKRTGEEVTKSVEYFRQAIEQDPSYALAYTGLADAYSVIPSYSNGSPDEFFPKAKAAAKRALELDESLAEAHTALARVLFVYDWNFAESDREYQRAIVLNPNYATAHHWYGNANLLRTGRFDESIAEMRRALELDPLSLIINADLGENYLFARRYDEAVAQFRKTIEMDQRFHYAHYQLGIAYQLEGFYQEAITEYKRARQLSNNEWMLVLLGQVYAVSGDKNEAFKLLAELKQISRQRYIPPYHFAVIYAALGEKDQAFQWLEKSYLDRGQELTRLKVDPFLDPLRDDPRFHVLSRKVGLPH